MTLLLVGVTKWQRSISQMNDVQVGSDFFLIFSFYIVLLHSTSKLLILVDGERMVRVLFVGRAESNSIAE